MFSRLFANLLHAIGLFLYPLKTSENTIVGDFRTMQKPVKWIIASIS